MKGPLPEFHGTDRFQIIRTLGRGGMGVVFEALDKERNLVVALKLLPELEPVSLYRFKQEFRALAELSHPNLVPLYELISAGEKWFFTMGLLDDAGDFFPRHRSSISTPRQLEEPEVRAGKSESAMDATIVAPRLPESSFSGAADDLDATLVMPAQRQAQSLMPMEGGADDLDATLVMAAQRRAPSPTQTGESADLEATLVMPARKVEAAAVAALPEMAVEPSPAVEVDYERVRKVFCQMAEGVCALHQAGKLHRDLKPGNVIVCRDGRVVLLDFGLVASLETPAPAPSAAARAGVGMQATTTSAGFISGTLAYMSPEQSDGQPLTLASDWYSVGVMLYEVLTGHVPFHSAGENFIVFKQRETPPMPALLQPGTPADLNDLCMALLSLSPAVRPGGEQVLAALSSNADSGAVRMQDVVPFVGREHDLRSLQDCWRRVTQGRTLTLHVHGPSGTGKTSLVRHFLDSLKGPKGPVILCGRCYEQESVPFKALDSVVDALTQHLLMLQDYEVERLLPDQTGALTRVFPVLNRVPAVAVRTALDGSGGFDLREVRGQAFTALRELFRGLAKGCGLIVCVDDLQWGDVDSAALLTDLVMQPNAPRMLMVLTYRTEYIGQSACLRALAGSDRSPDHETIALQPLSTDDTRRLAVELLGSDDQEQAEWVVRESRGTAFFVYELARHVKSRGRGRLAEGVNLDAVLWERLSSLPVESRRVLELVAIAGEPLALRTIQDAGGMSPLPPQVITQLRAAQVVRTSGPGLDDEIECFHDRVRETMLQYLPVETRRAHHGALAETLEAGGAKAEKLAPHFESSGRLEKAGHCYSAAANEAVAALAFSRAEEFFHKAAALIPEPLARAAVHEKMVHFYTDTARFADAYKVTREAVQAFGIQLPQKFVPPLMIGDFLLSKWRMRGTSPAAILDRPVMSDPRLVAAVRLINAGAKAAYQVRPELCVSVSIRAVNLCLKHGITPDCAICWMVYGTIFQGGILGRHRTGHDFGRLALGLVDKFQNERQRAEVNFVVGYFGTSWLRPADEAEQLWRTAWQAGLETGDLFHTGCAGAGLIISQFMRGVPFDEVLSEADRILPILERASLREPVGVITAVRQAIRNLRGQTSSRDSFSDAGFDEESFCAALPGYGSRHFAHIYFILRLQTLYLHGLHDQAAAFANSSSRYLKESPGMLHSAEHHFYSGMNSAALATHARGLARLKLRRRLGSAHKRFRRWARQCPENFAARERLLAAEIARLGGRMAESMSACAAARDAAGAHGAPHLAAIADRCMAGLRAA